MTNGTLAFNPQEQHISPTRSPNNSPMHKQGMMNQHQQVLSSISQFTPFPQALALEMFNNKMCMLQNTNFITH